MIKKVGVAAAAVMLLAGCASSASGNDAAESSSSSSAAPAEDASSTIDCTDAEGVPEDEWMDACAEDLPSDSEDPDGSMGETVPVDLDEKKTYPDGLEITVKNWRAGKSEVVDEPYVAFDVAIKNTGDKPIPFSFTESAIFGDTGEQADASVSEEAESTSRRLQPGADDSITGTVMVPNPEEPAMLTLEFIDQETFEAVRPEMLVKVNGGLD